MQNYTETNCTIEHNGRQFTSGGAVVTPDYLIGYPAEDGTLRDWHGTVLGACRVISSRPAVFFGHRSWQGSRYYFMRATIDGREYALRGFGTNMIARGRALKARNK